MTGSSDVGGRSSDRQKGSATIQPGGLGASEVTVPLSSSSDGGEKALAPRRVEALDLLRGLVVALMVLDHVREYFSAQAFLFDPLDVSQTSPSLFATRWITHLCAPTFVFLAGLSAHLQLARGMAHAQLRRRLVTRGLWLILLEVTVVGFGFTFTQPLLFLQVIWAIGIGMVLLAGLTFLPHWAAGVVGLVAIAGTPMLAAGTAAALPPPLWHALLMPGPLTPLPGIVAYPAVPWFGILALGYAVGPLLARTAPVMRRRAIIMGALLIALFVVLRLSGVGDVRTGVAAPTSLLQALSHLNISKYPPSIQFATLTLGLSSLLLALLTALPARWLPMLHAFGRAPFFTYILHIYIIHVLAFLVGLAMGFQAAIFAHFIDNPVVLKEAGWGFSLAVVYAIWVGVLLVLRPASIWFARIKGRGERWWLSYL